MTKAKQLSKSAYDYSHVKSVSAWALLFNGEQAGKVVANWSDNPMGSVCTCTITVYAGPGKVWKEGYKSHMTGQAGGCGYDKLSGAFSDALHRFGVAHPNLHGAGSEACKAWLRSLGYTVIEVL